jgi:hypothetical protein
MKALQEKMDADQNERRQEIRAGQDTWKRRWKPRWLLSSPS